MPSYPEIAGRLFNTPLLVHAGKARAIVDAMGPRILGAPVAIEDGPDRVDHVAGRRPNAGRLGDPLAQYVSDQESLFRIGSVGVIPVEGTLVHKGKWLGAYSGTTSYEGVFRRVNAARKDPQIRGVVYEVDSFGGEISGAFDVAEAMFELSAEKPTIAILTDHAYSAGYLLASAARQIIAPATGGAGSIGIVALHTDFSAWLEEAGIKVTILSAGAHKAEGNPFEALPEDVAKKWREEMETMRKLFADAVGRFRGNRFNAAAALATEAECFIGDAALSAGLIDAVARPSEAFEAFRAEIDGGAG